MYNKLRNKLTKAEDNKFVTGVNTDIVQFTQSLLDMIESGGDIVIPQDLIVKADKVVGAASGNFAGLDVEGNLTDSGYNYTSFATSSQAVIRGGSTGQVLAKRSNADNDLEWINQSTQIQSDWNESNINSAAYIKNKPTITDGLDWEEF